MGRKLLLKDVTERAKEMGFEFLDDVYINSTHKHTFRCLKHESVCNVPFNSIDRGQGFKCCKDAALRSQFKLSDDIVRERFSNLGFTLLGEYINSQTPIDIKCFCGKIFKDTPMLIWQQDVKSCGCVSYPTGKNNGNWKGYQEIGNWYFRSLRRGAVKREMEFSITMEYMWELFISNNKKCYLSGEEIRLEPSSQLNFKTQTASLDRIDSNLGYIEGNIQWIHKEVNRLKQNFSDEKFIEWCKKISLHQQNESKIKKT